MNDAPSPTDLINSLDRRNFVRKSAFATGALTFAGLIKAAHGGPPSTTTGTSTTATFSFEYDAEVVGDSISGSTFKVKFTWSGGSGDHEMAKLIRYKVEGNPDYLYIWVTTTTGGPSSGNKPVDVTVDGNVTEAIEVGDIPLP